MRRIYEGSESIESGILIKRTPMVVNNPYIVDMLQHTRRPCHPYCGTRLWVARDYRPGKPSRPITVQDFLPVIYIVRSVSRQEGNAGSDGSEAVCSKLGRCVALTLAILSQ